MRTLFSRITDISEVKALWDQDRRVFQVPLKQFKVKRSMISAGTTVRIMLGRTGQSLEVIA